LTLLAADTAWALPWRTSVEQCRTYAANRQVKGFNSALPMSVQPVLRALGSRHIGWRSIMTQWHSGDVDANGIRLHYTRTGGEKPPLVLAHGFTDDGLCWTPVAQALETDHDVIMFDARGHGRSDAPEQGYESATQAADLAGAIRGLGLHRPAVLGHSMGAVASLALAGIYPDVPGAILLEDPPGWWSMLPEPAPAEEQEREISSSTIYGGERGDEDGAVDRRTWFNEIKRKTRAELLAEQRVATPSWSEAELEPWADSKLRVSPKAFGLLSPATPYAVDWKTILPRITCPVLLITADLDRGAILTEAETAALQALVPHIQVVQIPGAGHNIRREQFARYLEVVRAFLAEHTVS
jgi:pimeloyl-ACP methyl ester carboxylesterase